MHNPKKIPDVFVSLKPPLQYTYVLPVLPYTKIISTFKNIKIQINNLNATVLQKGPSMNHGDRFLGFFSPSPFMGAFTKKGLLL